MSEDVATDIGQHEADVQPTEKMVPQSEVDKLVGAVKAKERQQAEAQYRQMLQSQSMGGVQVPGVNEDALLEKATQRMQATLDEQRREQELEQQKAEVDRVAKEYLEKMKQGSTLYDDFDQVTKAFKPGKFPQVAIWAAQQDNTSAIIYDLAKNPQKLAQLHMLALADPELAVDEITKLSQSIKRNEEAVNNNVRSPSPLSKLKSSAAAGSDTGKRSISDLRKQPWLRG
jgi:hypothetical protein